MVKNPNSAWIIEAALPRLIELWKEGVSQGGISREMHLTKHAVNGKVQRLVKEGVIEPRGSPVKPGPKPRDETPRPPVARPAGKDTLPKLPSLMMELPTITNS